MAQTIRRFPQFTLNTDGNPHPRENTLVGIAAVLGLIAVVSAFFPSLHLLSSWAGLFGIIAGLWGQFVSVTTAERFVLMIALGMAALGFYLGIAHGGLYGGLW
ncbi:hypothetical protein [Kitasatospora sp. GP82]|uniref:hypothetical protein n=1 Tax=Kitasatospora sp. GP82 TaxID=3035089 RepID=UPI002475629F|nr:hypothetical protein [Kitasatospora sp. GP82]MDH6127674.1 hypothetical protein [Kitasatospora sp. GP82]